MATGEYCGIILVLAFCASAVVECQITSSPGNQTVCIGEDLDLEWVYGDALNFLTVTWAFIDSSSTTISILEQVTGLPAEIKNNFNVVHKSNGGITLTRVNQANTGSYKISVVYSSATPSADDTVTVTVNDCSNCTCECKCKCKRIVIPSIVFGILGMLDLPVVIGGTVTEHFGRTTALIVDFIGIVCDVISFVLGIVVQIIDCCKAADCCEDSDCCKDECESRNWIENTGAAFIAIGALVGIVAVAIFYLIWSNRMGPGNNAYKAKEAKHPDENHGMTGTSM